MRHVKERPSGPDLSGLRRLSPDAAPPKKQDKALADPLRALLFVLLAAVIVALPWVVFTGLLGKTPRKGPVPGASKAATVSPAPAVNLVAGLYEITGDIKCLRIRTSPGSNQEIFDCVNIGVRVRSDGRSEDKDGFTWLHIHDPFRDLDGWAASKYLIKVGT